MKRYYKGLDRNLFGRNGFQYEIGKDFTAGTDDSWRWLHFAKKVKDAIRYGVRVVEVEPLTAVCRYGSYADMNAEKIRIVRELSRDEICRGMRSVAGRDHRQADRRKMPCLSDGVF